MTAYIVGYGGERLDKIAKKLLQTERDGTVEALLKANRRLADLMQNGVVPEGTAIDPPKDFRATPSTTFTLPWE